MYEYLIILVLLPVVCVYTAAAVLCYGLVVGLDVLGVLAVTVWNWTWGKIWAFIYGVYDFVRWMNNPLR